jgi:methyltransferase (TIGR00027 family)
MVAAVTLALIAAGLGAMRRVTIWRSDADITNWGVAMKKGRASRTAEHNALFRALETSRPRAMRLFDDPFAKTFLTGSLKAVQRMTVLPAWRDYVIRYLDGRWPGVRSSVVARTRLIDDTITTSVDGMGQLVILGAGYDSRALRLASVSALAVFEVDHPDTQHAKQRALRRFAFRHSPAVRYIPCDFNQGQLESTMSVSRYRPDVASIILWEGVTNYLTEEAVDETLRWCAGAAEGSLLIFTYIHRDILTNPAKFQGSGQLLATLSKVGENLTFGFDPDRLETFLADRGLRLEQDLGAAEYRALYFGDEAAQMRGHEFYRIAFVRIVP